ncbi:MAG: carbamoyl-phosphate synthase large subunit, partial [Pseudomonadota bacterium]
WAINPKDGRMVVIEMNPRVSRSSALASKATGFPIAKVAAKLAVGYTLDELDNDITKVTPASFEPTIDYVVTKIPRFAFEKFPGAKPELTTAMKSVGEAMAIGRTFHESLQKALASMETGLTGLDEIVVEGMPAEDKITTGPMPERAHVTIRIGADPEAQRAIDKAMTRALSVQTPDRLRIIAEAMRFGFTDDEIFEITSFDPWFLARIREIVEAELRIRRDGLPLDADGLRRIKMLGFSDARLARLTGRDEDQIRRARQNLGVRAVFKRIDTCAAEFEAQTPYMYSTYETPVMDEVECEARPSDAQKVVILGGGPNRIGQGIEFDYCCCHACFALTEAGYETIMVNCNPETVSTDYDTSDRLYFDPLTFEHVMEVLRVEQEAGTLHGVIVQFGGQTPLKLANALHDAGIPILGTSPDAIDLAEDRERFQKLVQDLGLKQPNNAIASTDAEAIAAADSIGFPLVIRPSYVLGGRAMEIVRDSAQLERYIAEAVVVSGTSPVLLDSYLAGATEVDVDALCDGTEVRIAGIMQHIEEAGVHSGDSACSLPPYSLGEDVVAELTRQTEALAMALGVVGLMNVQFAVQGSDIFLIEVNPRASRTVPFVAKAIGSPIASIAARLMAGETLDRFELPLQPSNRFAVKEAVLPFARFPGVDTILGPEMRSTGEVMGADADFAIAFAKAQLGAGMILPRAHEIADKGAAPMVFLSIKEADKTPDLIQTAQILHKLGFAIIATRGTAKFVEDAAGVPSKVVNKVYEGRPNIVDVMKDGKVHLVLNTTEGAQAVEDSRSMRNVALMDRIPYFTTLAASHAAALAMEAREEREIGVRALQAAP